MWYSTSAAANYHRWYCSIGVVMNLSAVGLVLPFGRIYNYQAAQTAITTATSRSLTIAELINAIVQVSVATAITLTLPTGSATHTGMIGSTGSTIPIEQSFDWSIINTGSATGAITVAASATHTTIGALVVAIGASGQFRTRLSTASTAITYRLS